MEQIIRWVILGVDLFLLLAFILYLLFGFIKGWRKSILRMVSFLIPFALYLCFSGIIAKALLNISLPEIGTIKDYVTEMVCSYLYEGESVVGPEMYALCEDIAIMALRVALYIVGLVLIGLIIAPLIRLIFALTLKKFIKRKEKPHLASRFIGMGIGFVRFSTFIMVLFFPLFGICNIADIAIDDVNTIQEKTEVKEDDKQYIHVDESKSELTQYQEWIHSSYVYQVIDFGKNRQTGLNVAGSYLGSLTKIKTEHGDLNIIKEYGNIRGIFPVVLPLFEEQDGEIVLLFDQMNTQQVNQLTTSLEKIKILKVLLPVLQEYGCYKIEISDQIENSEKIIQEIKKADLEKELDLLLEVVCQSIVALKGTKVSLSHPEEILLIETLPENIDKIMVTLLQSTLVNELLLPKASEFIQTSLEDMEIQTEDLGELLTQAQMKLCLQNDVSSLLRIYQDLAENANLDEMLFKEGKLDFTNSTAQEALSRSIVKILELKLIAGHENTLLKFSLSLIQKEGFTYEELIQDIVPNWEVEKNNLANIIVEIIHLFGEKFQEDSFSMEDLLDMDDDGNFVIEPLILKISASDFIRQVAIQYLENNVEKIESETLPPYFLESLQFETLKNLSKEDFQTEMLNVLDILKTLIQMHVLSPVEGEIILSAEYIEKLVPAIFASALVRGNEENIVKFILEMTNLNDTLEENNITLQLENVNWETEPAHLVEIFKALYAFGNVEDINLETLMEDRTNTDKIIALFTAFGSSDIFEPVLYTLIETMIAETGYEIIISEQEKMSIKNNGWNNEFISLYQIIDTAETVFNSENGYSDVSGSEITEIMLIASTGVLATKIVGSFLNEMLGPDNLDINPTNPDGTPKYDFMDPNTLRNSAQDIGALIDLKKQVDAFDKTSSTSSADITQIVNQIETLEKSEIVEDFMGEVLGKETMNEFENVDFVEEAHLVQDVYETYEADPDNFQLSDHPELEQQINDSEIAKSILEILGILA